MTGDKLRSIHIGIRSVKTAIAATLCALIYLPLGRNPAFACIGAVFGTGSDMAGSKLGGGNRLFGTIVGGIIGMALFRLYLCFYPDGDFRALMLAFVFVGHFLLILLCQLIGWVGGIQPGSVVLSIVLFSTPVETYVSYAVNRIIDTAFGVLVAIIIAKLFPRERIAAWLQRLRIKAD